MKIYKWFDLQAKSYCCFITCNEIVSLKKISLYLQCCWIIASENNLSKNTGVQCVLDSVCDWLPKPHEVKNYAKKVDKDGEEIEKGTVRNKRNYLEVNPSNPAKSPHLLLVSPDWNGKRLSTSETGRSQ